MKNYFKHIHTKTPHDRRQHAVHVACIVTAIIALLWLGTLGLHFSLTPGTFTQSTGSTNADQTELANAASSIPTDTASLQVATTSVLDDTQQQ